METLIGMQPARPLEVGDRVARLYGPYRGNTHTVTHTLGWLVQLRGHPGVWAPARNFVRIPKWFFRTAALFEGTPYHAV